MKRFVKRVVCLSVLLIATARGQLTGEVGVLDPANANGGINPQTGMAWAEGDRYRLAFYTEDKRDALSEDITEYNAFVQMVAEGSTAFPRLGDATWKVLGSTATVSARQNTGTQSDDDLPIFVLDGVTMIAEDSADMWNGFPVRFQAADSPNGQIMFYAPYLNEDGQEIVEMVFGREIATGTTSGGGIASDPLGDVNNDGQRLTVGASRANTAGRVWARFGNRAPTANWSFFALSEPLTVTNVVAPAGFQLTIIPSPTTPGTYDFEWESQTNKLYDLVSDVDLTEARSTWPAWDSRTNLPSGGVTTRVTGVPGGAEVIRYFSVLEKEPPLP